MPTILKVGTKKSPFIISFTHNEIFNSVNKHAKKFHKFLNNNKDKILAGIHIQGDVRWLKKLPTYGWEQFYLWPNSSENFFENIDKKKIINLTCSSFFPNYKTEGSSNKIYDLSIITRIENGKNFLNTLDIINNLLKSDKKIKIALVAPVPASVHKIFAFNLFKKTMKNFLLDFKKKTFPYSERLSLFCVDQNLFGNYPLSESTINLIIKNSKFFLLNSTKEGVPRVLGEALLNNTPIILPHNFYSGFNSFLFSRRMKDKSVFTYKNHELNINKNCSQILKIINTSQFFLDKKLINNYFLESHNIPILKRKLNNILLNQDLSTQGEWLLDNLKFRLACHGRKFNYQFTRSPKSFFQFIKEIKKIKKNKYFYCDDKLYLNSMKCENKFNTILYGVQFILISYLTRICFKLKVFFEKKILQ